MTPDPLATAPVTVPLTVDVQVKFVPAILAVGVKLIDVPEQIVVRSWVFVTAGILLTVNVTGKALPVQPSALGVTEYVAVPDKAGEVTFKSWLIKDPVPDVPPVVLF